MNFTLPYTIHKNQFLVDCRPKYKRKNCRASRRWHRKMPAKSWHREQFIRWRTKKHNHKGENDKLELVKIKNFHLSKILLRERKCKLQKWDNIFRIYFVSPRYIKDPYKSIIIKITICLEKWVKGLHKYSARMHKWPTTIWKGVNVHI